MAQAKKAGIVKASPAPLAQMEDWEKDLVNKAKDTKAAEVVGIPRITHRGSVLKIDDKKVEGNRLQVVIVTYGLTKTYYAEGFDPDAPAATPVCYAFAPPTPGAEAQMKPHEASPDRQHEQCTGCPHNKFGTAEKGKGKRCSDTRKVLVLVGNTDPGSVASAQVRQISIPPGSLRNWSNYLRSLDDLTPYGVSGVVTEITTEAMDSGAYQILFKAVATLEKEQVRAIYAKAKQVESELSTPFPVLEAEEKPKSKKKVKGQD